MPSDELLVKQILALKDTAAFGQLVERYQAKLLLLFKHLAKDPQIAEDLCQNTFLKVWDKLARFRADGRFAAWISRLAYNEFRQYYRYKKRRPEELGLELEHTHKHPGDIHPVAPIPCDELADLEKLLAVVSHDEQIVLTLNYAHGLTIVEIADVLGISAAKVKSQIHRAKLKIRAHFSL